MPAVNATQSPSGVAHWPEVLYRHWVHSPGSRVPVVDDTVEVEVWVGILPKQASVPPGHVHV